MDARSKLASMTGKTYMYNARLHKIMCSRFQPETDCWLIGTNRDIIIIPNDEIVDTLKEEFQRAAEESTTAMVVSEEGQMINNVLKDLSANIDKTKADPGYVKQANAIAGQVNAMVSIVKVMQRGRQ